MVGHGPPRVVFRRGLREPDVAGVTGELPALQGPDDRVAVANLATRGVDDIRPTFHLGDELVVEQMLGLGMQRAVNSHNVANANHGLDVRMVGDAELLFDGFR